MMLHQGLKPSLGSTRGLSPLPSSPLSAAPTPPPPPSSSSSPTAVYDDGDNNNDKRKARQMELEANSTDDDDDNGNNDNERKARRIAAPIFFIPHLSSPPVLEDTVLNITKTACPLLEWFATFFGEKACKICT